MTAPQPIDFGAAKVRLTQPERVAAMRARLLDATIECLVDKGYSEMSTNDVVRRAGVSRGALAHHFPTKAELVAAAGERLIELRAADYRALFADMPAERRTLAGALDLLWSFYEGPTFAALIELTVSARTNPELRRVFATAPDRIATATMDVFNDLFPQFVDNPFAQQIVDTGLAALAGLALQSIVDDDRHGRRRAVLELIKSLGTMALPISPQEAT